MQIETLKVDQTLARQFYQEYAEALRERHNDEYEALKRGFYEIANGGQVLELPAVFRGAGMDQQGRPKLAIARADWPWVEFRAQGDGCGSFQQRDAWWDRRRMRSAINLPRRTFAYPQNGVQSARAMVPMIPPGLRPMGNIARFHILWEAEWVDVPVDPFLLRHLGGPFWAIVAQWDLTPLEQAIMRMKL